MDLPMSKLELTESERTLICNILGYINYSSGSFNPQFVKAWDDLYRYLDAKGYTEPWRDSVSILKSELLRLTNEGGAFSNSEQAQRTLELIPEILSTYRSFHKDTLHSVDSSYLFNSFFMARLSRVIIQNDPLTIRTQSYNSIIKSLNNFLGYRPIPIMEHGEKHEPNEHEWIAVLPLYYEGVGVAFGRYQRVVEITLDILREVDADILHDASFIPEKLRELAVDPRAYDFDHPVNRRVNYSFGTWDDRCIDKDGYYRRFVIHRTTLDAIMSRVWIENNPERQQEYEYEAAAVLAGTILMASGICGGHVQSHDSTVSLGTLTPIVAAYRDLFYERLIEKTPEPLKTRLLEESHRLFQPFAGVRQYLNQFLAKKRADQLQRFSLARTYARMGYFKESKHQSNIIETTASRLLSEIDCYITKAHLSADTGNIEEATNCLTQIEELLYRGLDCGAFPDPWFILGFDSQYSLFPSIENGIHDHRLDGLIDLLNDIFDLYSRLQKEAAAVGNTELRLELSDKMSNLADWWDQFGSTEVSSVEGFSGQEVWESAAEVSRALAVWNKAGKTIGDVKFWKSHVERFKTPKAFVLLCEALLDKHDLVSSSSLLIYWLDQSQTIPLTENDYSFHSVVFNWMEEAWNLIDKTELRRTSSNTYTHEQVCCLKQNDYLARWKTTTKFLDYFGENSGNHWIIPKLDLPKDKFDRKIEFNTDNSILAELSRQLLLAVTFLGKTGTGTPKIRIKSSFKDAVRSLDSNNFPTPEEFQQFYNDNAHVFPKYMTFFVFMQIILNEVHMPQEQHNLYIKKLFNKDCVSFSVANPQYTTHISQDKNHSDPNNKSQQSDSIDEQKHEPDSHSQKNKKQQLWNAISNELNGNDSVSNLQDLIDKIITESKTHKSNQNEYTIRDNNNSSIIISNSSSNGDYNEEPGNDTPDLNLEEMYGEDQEVDEEGGITGSDPTFSAAYEHMSYQDTANDGIEDDIAEGKSFFSNDHEENGFARETDRISDQLTFIFTTVRLWKFAAGRSPLLVTPTDGSFTDQVFEEARLYLEGWRDQAIEFEHDLYELLDQASRYRIEKPAGTNESLIEYDQLRGTKEILLDRIIWTIVEVEDVIVFLKAILRDETTEKYAKPWKALALKTFSAIFRSDVKKVRNLWPQLLEKLEKETLLYIPTSRGGDAKTIVESRRLQQVVLCLLRYAPRLGLLYETFQLVKSVQIMEQIRLSEPGSITEYDRLVEVATRSIAETFAKSSKKWQITQQTSPFASQDEALVYYLISTTDIILKSWLSHSHQIRISSIEAIAGDYRWKIIQNFIQTYGADLFTQEFLSFRNIRAILHQSALSYLQSLIIMKQEGQELDNGDKIITALINKKERIEDIANILEVILECVAENYSEYIDYNSTTTQSDRGENLYTLLDFLRVLSNYERISWNLKPVYWTHDSLVRSNCSEAATLWKNHIKQKSAGLAESSLQLFNSLHQKYGIWLPSIYERLQERFIRPLEVAQMCGLVYEAISEVRKNGEDNPIFEELSEEIEAFAETPAGVGFELPEWLNKLQEEVVLSRVDSKEERRELAAKEDPFESIPFLPITMMTVQEIERQVIAALNDEKLKD